MSSDFLSIFLPSVLSFIVGIGFTPFWTNYLYKNKMWKKKSGKLDLSGKDTPIFNELHKDKEVGTPRMGGVVIWFSVLSTAALLWVISKLVNINFGFDLDYVSRSQTWIPFATLILGSLVGLVDDYLEIIGSKDNLAGGLSLKKRLIFITIISLFCAIWFYSKLGIHEIGMPHIGFVDIGVLFVPLFMLVAILIYSGGVIDGIDGLSGGVFASIFSAYTGIAFYLGQIHLATFCATIVGGILAFLWFNIPPARFYMTETGSMGLTITLTIVAFMTDKLGGGYGLIALPVVAMPLIATTLSNVIQLFSKRFRGKKVFLVAPLHHHFEALGWPAYKVTMRFWVVSIIFAILGMVIAIASITS